MKPVLRMYQSILQNLFQILPSRSIYISARRACSVLIWSSMRMIFLFRFSLLSMRMSIAKSRGPRLIRLLGMFFRLGLVSVVLISMIWIQLRHSRRT